MLMYFFMLLYFSLNFYGTRKSFGRHGTFVRSLVYLFFCGLFMGLAVACKWQGAYAMVGLPILLFYVLYKRWKEYAYARHHHTEATSLEAAAAMEKPSLFQEDSGNTEANNASEETPEPELTPSDPWTKETLPWDRLRCFPAYAAITLTCCLVFFIVIPAAIYALSYIPFLQTPNQNGLATILKNQRDMLHYHGTLISTHAYSSQWFQWPFMTRPIYYYSGSSANGWRMGISSFGNPAVWWMGVAALILCIRAQSKKFDKLLLFLFVAYASQYLPWTLVSRTTYIYHYFPSVPFVILLITYFFKHRYSHKPRVVFLYLTVTLALFILFYPVISGLPIPMTYGDFLLRWMPAWVLS
jgi:dolichyl-phosphate-mannose--protein O-mannosyl transferase